MLRQAQCEYRPFCIRFLEADAAAVLFSYSPCQGEPQTGSVRFSCGHKRIEQRPPHRGSYAGTIIQDCDEDLFIDFRNLDPHFRKLS